MTQSVDVEQYIGAGETATIENTLSTPLRISVISENGCHFEIDLRPAQVVGVSAGGAHARIILHDGDPLGLLVIKPEAPS